MAPSCTTPTALHNHPEGAFLREASAADTGSTVPSRPVVAVLSSEIAGKIAAGECVERPASVVKELVENSLDAGATRVTVEMEDGGRALIRVIDNGCGLTREDIVLAVQRHATSKLKELDDLTQIHTLGFRGEALPSVAAVSRLEILSSADDATPNRLIMTGSEIEDLCSFGAPPGTSVTVRDLFFNTPARLKFLRSAQTEFGHALEHLTRLAIAHHDVAFRVVHNGREALNTPGSPDPLNAIVAAYGPDVAREMIAIHLEAPPVRVHGYVSRPALTRANRSQQSFFVNRRWVRNRTIGHALDQAYRTLLTVGRHPIAAILIELPSDLVDVNVHPTKAEVRFVRDWEIHQAVARAVKDALLGADLVPQVRAPSPSRETLEPMQAALWKEEDTLRDLVDSHFNQAAGASPVQFPAVGPSEWDGMDPLRAREGAPETVTFDSFSTTDRGRTWLGQSSDAENKAMAERSICAPLQGARLVGQCHGCYILLETSDGIALIDQHAAHERILYEKLLARSDRLEVQRLVVPLTLNLGRREAALAMDRLEDFRALGFQMESFGPGSFLVRTVPLFARRINHEDLLRDIVDEMAGSEFGRKVQFHRERIAASMACRAAVKAGDMLSMPEMAAIVDGLRGTDTAPEIPTNCPHGRPTTIHLPLAQIERLFRRT